MLAPLIRGSLPFFCEWTQLASDPKPSSSQPAPPSAADDFKRYISRGLAALLPTILTIAILIWSYDLIDRHLGQYITRGMVALFATGGPPEFISPDKALEHSLTYGTPIDEWDARGQRLTVEYKIATLPILEDIRADEEFRKRAQEEANTALWSVAFVHYRLNLIGFLIAFVVVYFVGRFLASLIGRTSWRMIERLLYRVPVIKALYPNIKQVTDFVLSERNVSFSGVVAVPYPRKGLWSIGLVTGPPLRSLAETEEQELITVFIPSSPTPVTGYTITVKRQEVIDLGFSLDEAMRYTISAGVIKPRREECPDGLLEGESLD